MKNKTAFVIIGPTAVGKTEMAIRLAQYLGTKIISADSRQCFKELNIGVAKPSATELASVHHYFVNSHSIHEEVNAALFEKLSLQWVEKIFHENDHAVIVGGTGLYVKAFCEGLDEIPEADDSIRKEIQSGYLQKGMSWLQEQIQINDPQFCQQGEIQNPQRTMRALEIKLSTGKSILSFRSKEKKQRSFSIKKIGLHLPKEKLHSNMHHRVDKMFDDGLEEEAGELSEYKKLNALQTVGYTELFDYFDGKINLSEAKELIKKNTRHYAKRQMTWFRKDENIQWILPGEWEQIKKITQS